MRPARLSWSTLAGCLMLRGNMRLFSSKFLQMSGTHCENILPIIVCIHFEPFFWAIPFSFTIIQYAFYQVALLEILLLLQILLL